MAVLFFLKPGQLADDPVSGRSISLTSCVGKFMVKIVNARLVLLLEANHLLSPLTIQILKDAFDHDVLVRVTSNIYRPFENQKSSLCAFFVMQKAYRIPHGDTVFYRP